MNPAAMLCARCKRTAHGGPCAIPQPLPAAPVRQAAARQAAHAGRAAAPDAPRLERARAIANTWRTLHGASLTEAEAWYTQYLAADSSVRRALCFELDR